jgi:hypothetical protein
MQLIGYKDGNAVHASPELIAAHGIDHIRRELELVKYYPVKTDLSGNTVMVEAKSQEEAIEKYLNRRR